MTGNLRSEDCLLGLEFSGHDQSGRRVMGLVPAKGLATVVDVHRNYLWPVPDQWTLEQAATVPVAYATAFYSLVVRGNIRPGETILIHAGSGAVGQAAISIALSHGCRVLTTVGSAEKRSYLQKRFSGLSDASFADSRDSKFWRTILRATDGRGVDVVLNSLAEDKLQSSVQLLAQHGRFLEIGKYDLANNASLGKLTCGILCTHMCQEHFQYTIEFYSFR
jgi:fatty acid synthase